MRAPSLSRGQFRVMAGSAVALAACLTLAVAAVAETPEASATAPDPGASATAPDPGASMPPRLAIEAAVASGTIDATGATWIVRTPRLLGPLDAAVLETIDAALATGVEDDLAAFEAGSSAPIDEAMSSDEFSADFTVALLAADLASLRVLTYTYPSGAAHGGTALETWTFDLRTGRRLALADLFSPGADYLGAIATETRRSLLDRYAIDRSSRQWVKDGTRPKAANYSGWALTPDGLEITFGQYQVAPYAAGMPVVVIGWSRLAGLLDPAGPAAAYLEGAGRPAPLPSPSMSPGPA
jgi:hypothetical protein